ncbi:MAG: XTP/dITP diphosphatase [Clostridia bacterium]|nr:XTP/dITP diphosphatase [Clostridia bacterium]
MRIIAATKNKGKIREIAEILGELGIEVISQADAGIDVEIIESGTTFAENARIKAEAVSLLCNDAVLADDSGLCVEALDGAPGVFSARYSGEHATDSQNTQKLLNNLAGEIKRDAYFESAIVLIFPDGRELCTSGRVTGRITTEPFGGGGFGYDPVFFCTELGKTFGEATDEEKNKVSHRARALQELFELLKTE